MNSLPPSIRSSSSRRCASSSSSISRVGRIAGDLLDPVVRVGDARDLWQVRDRDHLRPFGEPLQRGRDRVRGLAADARVDLVEDERLAPADRSDRERDARELAAGRGLRHRAEGQAGVRADQEDGLVDAGRAGIALAQLHPELAVAHADATQLVGHRGGERLGRLLPGGPKPRGELLGLRLGGREGFLRCGGRVETALERGQLLARRGGTRKQVLVVRRAEAAAGVADPLQLSFDVLDAVGLGLQRREEAAEVGAELAQPQLEVSQLLARPRELGCEALERGERALGGGGEPRGPLTFVRRERLGCTGGALCKLGQVA